MTYVVEQLASTIFRLTAPNPSIMTGAGTNTYIIGQDKLMVIDPGPNDEEHIKRILDFAKGRIHWIAVTHTHKDHSPAAVPLSKITQAPCIGLMPRDMHQQDQSFQADIAWSQGDSLSIGDDVIHAISTPGHVENHLCFWLEKAQYVFAGDHLIEGGTVAILPPSGDMYEYMKSLEKLLDYSIAKIAPGHGKLIEQPIQHIKAVIKHRLARESKLVQLLTQEPIHIDTLLPQVYDDVDSQLLPLAKYSLLAHLIKLEKDQRVQKQGDCWQFS